MFYLNVHTIQIFYIVMFKDDSFLSKNNYSNICRGSSNETLRYEETKHKEPERTPGSTTTEISSCPAYRHQRRQVEDTEDK